MHATLKFGSHPDTLCVLLFRNVANAADIRAAIVAKSLQPEAAFINATLLPDIFLLHVSAEKSLHDQVCFAPIVTGCYSALVLELLSRCEATAG